MSGSDEAAPLRTLAPPWVHVVTSVPSLESAGPDALLVSLEGSRMRTFEGLFREFVRAFEFPEYFGWNWAAFDECICDLSWRPAKSYLVLVRNGEQLLVDEEEELPTFRRLMEKAGITGRTHSP